MTQRGKRLPVAPGKDVQQVVAETIEYEEMEALTKQQSDVLRSTIQKLNLGMNLGCMELGRLLRIVKTKNTTTGKSLYKSWGFSSFQDYCEKELGFSRTKGYNLSDLYEQTTVGLLTQGEVEKVGWSRLAMLLPLIRSGGITKKDIGRWIRKIDGKSFDEVRTIVEMGKQAHEKSKEEEESEDESTVEHLGAESGKKTTTVEDKTIVPEEIYNLRVSFSADQWENIQVALKKAEITTGSDKLPWLLDCICMAFNSEAFSSKDEALEVMCQRIERVYSVELLALHSKTKQVVFGERLLRMVEAQEARQKRAEELAAKKAAKKNG